MSVIGLKVGPFEIVRRAWVPGPGRWYLARGDGDAGGPPSDVLVRVVAQDGGGDEHRAVQHQFEVLRDIVDPRIPAPIGNYGVVPGSPSIGALAVAAGLGAPLSDAIAMRGDESVVMTPATLLDLLLEVAEALEQAHTSGRVHGHLEPENVVLGPDGRVWVYGFGTDLEEDPAPGWMSPEQARGAAATAETDQWALGSLALGLVLGQAMWRSAEPKAEAARGDASSSVEAVGQQWPALGRVLERLTDPRPHGRYPSMTEVREDLGELARIAGTRSDRTTLGALLCARRLEAAAPEETDLFAEVPRTAGIVAPVRQGPPPGGARPRVEPPPEGGAPTAVPLTDDEEKMAPEMTDPAGFFGVPSPVERTEELPPLPVARVGLSDAVGTPLLHRPPTGLSILTLAPILAGTMVVLLIVWLIVNLL